jgi:hypothetical protein
MAREHVQQGVVAGIARFAREIDRQEEIRNFIDNRFEATVEYVWKFVEPKQRESVSQEERWHPRGQRLFAEMFTIGDMARELLKERRLNDEQIEDFANNMPIWLNSFFHVRL